MTRRLRDAHAFLTRLPVPMPEGHPDGARLSRAAVMFPLVGVTVGVVAVAVRLGAAPLGALAATVAGCAAGPLVTGGFHEDGLADIFDGLGPADRTRRLEVMRDSRVGSFGALALVFSVLLRVALLAPLGTRTCCLALLTGHVLGRWSSLPLSRWVAPARRDGLTGEGLHVGIGTVLAGGLIALAVCVPALWWAAPGALPRVAVAVAAVTVVTALAWRRAFGGITGDTLGATNQLVELAVHAGVRAAV